MSKAYPKLPAYIPVNPYVFRKTDLVEGMNIIEFAVRNLMCGGKWFDPSERKPDSKVTIMHEIVSGLIHDIFMDVFFHGVEFNCQTETKKHQVKFYLRRTNDLPQKTINGLQKYLDIIDVQDIYLNANNMLVPDCKVIKDGYERRRFVKINSEHLIEINRTFDACHYKPKQFTILNYLNGIYKKYPDIFPEILDEICVRAVWNLAAISCSQNISLTYFSNNAIRIYTPSDKEFYQLRRDNAIAKVKFKKRMAKTPWNGWYYIALRDMDFYSFQEDSVIRNNVMYKWVEQAMAEERPHIVAVHSDVVSAIISAEPNKRIRNDSLFINEAEFKKWLYCYKKENDEWVDIVPERNYRINAAVKKDEVKKVEKVKKAGVVKLNTLGDGKYRISGVAG